MKKNLLQKAALLAAPAALVAGFASGTPAQLGAEKCYKLVMTPV